jgi:hypothetical protein
MKTDPITIARLLCDEARATLPRRFQVSLDAEPGSNVVPISNDDAVLDEEQTRRARLSTEVWARGSRLITQKRPGGVVSQASNVIDLRAWRAARHAEPVADANDLVAQCDVLDAKLDALMEKLWPGRKERSKLERQAGLRDLSDEALASLPSQARSAIHDVLFDESMERLWPGRKERMQSVPPVDVS